MFVPSALAIAAALWIAYLVALAVEKRIFDQAIRRWKSLSKLGKCVVALVLIGFVAFAGTKPSAGGGDDTGGSSTNDVTQVEGDASSTNDVGWIEGDATNLVGCVDGEASTNVTPCGFAASSPLQAGAFAGLSGSGASSSSLTSGQESASTLSESSFSLVSVGHDEVFDFTPPGTAVVATNWLLHGASTQPIRLSFCDWEFPFGEEAYSNFTVFASGEVMPGEVNTNAFLKPFAAPLGIVPQVNWHLLSQFWHGLTPSNTLLLTWQNALLGRETNSPVSFQAELNPNGGFAFRYDLSRLAAAEQLTNAVVAVRADGTTFADEPTTNLTSLAFESHDGQACDAGRTDFDEKIGDLNPYAYPEGSTNTVLEHVFYSGTTNGAFAYPQSTDGTAVLIVSVSGRGSGELMVGSKFVPLVGRPAPARGPRLLAPPPPSPTTLAVSVPRGSTQRVYLRGDSTLSVSFDSNDFAFGSLPDLSGRRFTGWINFPLVNATVPCIHDYNARKKLVSLPLGSGAGALACTWEGTDKIEAENIPPVSAMLTGRFSGRTTTPVTYTLFHPDYLFGQTTYSQTARYCPQPPPESEDEPDDSQGGGYYDGEDEDDHVDCWCCFWGSCWEGCGCGCSCDVGSGDEPEEPLPPVDPTPEDYEEASTNCQHLSNVLYIREPLDYSTTVRLAVPSEHRNCCPCPDHATNWVAAVYKSGKLSVVGPDGLDFTSSGESLDVRIAGVTPSASVGDAEVSFAANGEVTHECRYTVLGVGIEGGERLRLVNAKSPYFGLPMTVTTNVWQGAELDLVTKVHLPDGNIQLRIEADSGQFSVWFYDGDEGEYVELVNSSTRPVCNKSFAAWRKLVGGWTDPGSSTTPVMITSEQPGRATLVYRYWNVTGDNRLVEDAASQAVSSVSPPLLPDYDRDGSIDGADVGSWLAGRRFRFWTNEDVWTGDSAFTRRDSLLWWDRPANGSDSQVNGRNDLVNLAPFRVDLRPLLDAWGKTDVECVLYTYDPQHVRFAFADVSWADVNSLFLADVKTTDDEDLHAAHLRQNAREGWREVGCVLPDGFLDLAEESAGVVAMEFGQHLTSMPLALVVRLKDSHEELYRFELPVDVYDVESLFRMVNLAGVCGDEGSSADCPAHDLDQHAVDESDADVVFVHGYNMAPREARVWAQAMFKRLWRMGMDARFTAVTWRGNETQAFVPGAGYVTPNYYQNVLNAFKTAPYLAQTVNALSGTHKFVIAHSLGNMLVSAAAQFHGLTYDKFFMVNAAIAREAFDPVGGITSASHDAMTPETWTAYPDRVRATHWYELFPQGDGRRLLTWKGIFSSVGNVVNYYSPEDEVLQDGDGSLKLLGRAFAWYNQETRKGYFPYVADNEAGWEFNPQYDVETTQYIGGNPITMTRHLTGTEANALTDEQLKTSPFFSGFHDETILVTSNGVDIASNLELRARVLAHGIPAESFAVGTGEVGNPGLWENVDMTTVPNGGNTPVRPQGHQLWTHSAFIGLPLKDVSRLFKDLNSRMKGQTHE